MFCTFTALSFLNPEPQFLLSELNQRMAPQFAKLNKSLIEQGVTKLLIILTHCLCWKLLVSIVVTCNQC